MAVWTKEFRAYVSSVEDKGKYSVLNLSVSEKVEGTYVPSDFGFVRFFGKAHEFAKSLKKGDIIKVTSCKITKQPYMKDGVKAYPKNEQWNVFGAEMFVFKPKEGAGAADNVLAPEDDIPF